VDRISSARRNALEPAAAVVSGMDNLEAVTIHIGVGKFVHNSAGLVVRSIGNDITKSDIMRV
jgi:hypothetical protein